MLKKAKAASFKQVSKQIQPYFCNLQLLFFLVHHAFVTFKFIFQSW